MPTYHVKSNDPIRAQKISEVHFGQSFLLLENGVGHSVTEPYLQIHNPRPGGYLIINRGWDSYCPCEFFEETFQEAEE